MAGGRVKTANRFIRWWPKKPHPENKNHNTIPKEHLKNIFITER
jgi:hypothetical protein